MSPTVIHVRAETKPLEHRTAITPTIAKKLVDDGYTVNVEKAPLSIFKDDEYEDTGASLVPTGSWTEAPEDHIIVGLKELPEEEFPLKHTACISIAWTLQNMLLILCCSMCNSPIATKVRAAGIRCLADFLEVVEHCLTLNFWKMVRVNDLYQPTLSLLKSYAENGRRVAAFGYVSGKNAEQCRTPAY